MNDSGPARSAFRFVFIIGIVNLFADLTYEGARGIVGPFLGSLGASAAIVGFIGGFGELIGSAQFEAPRKGDFQIAPAASRPPLLEQTVPPRPAGTGRPSMFRIEAWLMNSRLLCAKNETNDPVDTSWAKRSARTSIAGRGAAGNISKSSAARLSDSF